MEDLPWYKAVQSDASESLIAFFEAMISHFSFCVEIMGSLFVADRKLTFRMTTSYGNS